MTETARLQVGDKAPAFSLLDAEGKTVKLSDFKGRKVIVYFYPAAMTPPGCTKQACDFRDSLAELNGAGIDVVGISPRQAREAGQVHRARRADVPAAVGSRQEGPHRVGGRLRGEKKMYGKTVQGVIRSTFVVDANGKIEVAQYNVKATGHVAKLRRDISV